MKTRLFVAIIFIIVIAGVITYLLIPSPLIASGSFSLSTSSKAAYRSLAKQENWDKWLPESFFITRRLVNTIELDVKNKNATIPVSMILIPLSKDSVIVSWKTQLPVVSNPISKVQQYSQAVAVKEKMDHALQHFQSFVEHNENIYGVHIDETSITDTFLLATRFTSDTLPSNQLVYSHITKLRSYLTSAGAVESGPPMLNVSTIDSTKFSCMVALPINKIITGNSSFFFIRMVPGRFLTTQVTGGPSTIRHAHRMMDQYFEDFNRVTMAIPFEYLITDRIKETDTTKWVTKIYGPVY